MTGKMLDLIGTVVVAVVIVKGVELYGEYKYNKGFKAGKEEKK